MKEILFRISRPNEIFITKEVAAVQLPAVEGDITILLDRAPTILLLQNGLVRILDNQLKVVERYFVKGGVADVAGNCCSVSSEDVINADEVSLSQAKEQKELSLHEEDKNFYDYVINVLEKKQ